LRCDNSKIEADEKIGNGLRGPFSEHYQCFFPIMSDSSVVNWRHVTQHDLSARPDQGIDV
jgi:hypothetical protein